MLAKCSKCEKVSENDFSPIYCMVCGKTVCFNVKETCCRIVKCHAFGRDGCEGIFGLCQNEECLKSYENDKFKHCAKCFEAVPYHKYPVLKCPEPVEESISAGDPRCKGKTTFTMKKYCKLCNIPVCYHQKYFYCFCNCIFPNTDEVGKQICNECHESHKCGKPREEIY